MKRFLPARAETILLGMAISLLAATIDSKIKKEPAHEITTRLVLYLDQSGHVEVNPEAALDHIGESGSYVDLVANPSSFNCSNVGDESVVIMATRPDGSVANINVDVTVRDTLPPVLIVKDTTISLNDEGVATLLWSDVVDSDCEGAGNLCTKDNCSINYVLSQSDFSCSDVGIKTITVTATDAGGNSVTEEVKVTIVDNIAPVLVLRNNRTIGINNRGEYDISDSQVVDLTCSGDGNNCTKDACGFTLEYSQRHFTCDDLGENRVLVTATDPSGNSTADTLVFFLVNGVGPTMITRDVTIELDSNGIAELTPVMIDDGSFSFCYELSLSISRSAFNCDDIGTHTVTLTGVGDNNISGSANARVTIVDNMAPVVVTQNIAVDIDPAIGTVDIEAKDLLVICPDAIIEEDTGGGGGGFFGFVPGTGNSIPLDEGYTTMSDCTKDNCKITSITVNKERFGISDIGDNIVEVTVTDEKGNSATGMAVVTVNDHISPIAVSKDITIDLDSDGRATITPEDIDNGSSDNVSVILSIDKSEFTCADLGANIVTLTVEDPSGNAAVTTAVVVVRDILSPIITARDIEVQLNSEGLIMLAPEDLYDTIQEGCEIRSINVSQLSFSCDDLGENLISIRVEDSQGNEGTAQSFVTVQDVMSPVIVGTDLEIKLSDLGSEEQITIAAEQLYESVSDNCTLAGVSISKSVFGLNDIGDNSVQIMAQDAEGNSDTTTVNVKVIDDVPPRIVSRNLIIDLSAEGTVTIEADTVDVGSTDNIGISSRELSQSIFDCTHIGLNEIELKVTDTSGNESVAVVSIEVRDKNLPTIRTNPITVTLDDAGRVQIRLEDLDNGSSDVCGISQLSIDKNEFSCEDIGENMVVFSAKDVNGNENRLTVIVTVIDNKKPVIIPKNITVDLDRNGQVSLQAFDLYSEVSDNCSIQSIQASKLTFDCTEIGQNEVRLTAIDQSGNEQTAMAVVTVRDINAPEVITRNLTVNLDNSGKVSILPEDIDNGSADACGISQLSLSKTDFDCEDVGETVVTLIATDNYGNQGQATALVTIVDNIVPVIVPKNITANLDENGQVSLGKNQLYDDISDNCSVESIQVSQLVFDCDDVGENAVTITAIDNEGNQSESTAMVTIFDNMRPVIVPKNVTVELDQSGQATLQKYQLFEEISDNCKVKSIEVSKLIFACEDIGDNPITITAIDSHGNQETAMAVVTVQDKTSPIASVKNIKISLSDSGSVSITPEDINDGSSDACGIAQLMADKTEFTCEDIGENPVILTITDSNGNQGKATAIVTVEDTTVPVIIPKNITAALDSNGTVSLQKSQLYEDISDNCAVASIQVSPLVFDCSHVGENTVTITVIDSQGNQSVSMTNVTIFDDIKPVIVPKNVTVELDQSGQAILEKSQLFEEISDNCAVESIEASKLIFGCEDIGENQVALTATDSNGNQATAMAVVTIQDTTSPVARVKNITISLNQSGSASLTPEDINNGSSDACGLSQISLNKTEFTCDDKGENTVILTVTDSHGNQNQATALVTVLDNTTPVIVAKNIRVDLDENGQISLQASELYDEISDNCSIESIQASKLVFNCHDIGENEVNLKVTDSNGNEQTAISVVTVQDVSSPSVITQNISVSLDDNGSVTITPEEVDKGSTDSCGIAALALDRRDFNCSHVGENIVNLTVTDIHGNQTQATAIVTIVDNVVPVITPKSITVDLDQNGLVTLQENQLYETVSDNCSIQSIRVSKLDFDCNNVGENQVIITATDSNGNEQSAIAVVTVQDMTIPAVLTKDISVNLDNTGSVMVTPQDIDGGSADACGISELTLNKTEFTCEDLGENTVILSVTDSNGNQSQAMATVTVIDNTAPVIVVKKITVDLDQNGMVSLQGSELYEEITDNCSIQSIQVSKLDFDCTEVGENPVTITAVDSNENIQAATALVMVRDVTAPIASTKDITVSLDENGRASISPEDIDNGSSDTCGISLLTLDKTDFDCSDIGENIVHLLATDIHGNQHEAAAMITVIDNSRPIVTPKHITVALDQEGKVNLKENQVYERVSDNCSVQSILISKLTFDCNNIGENEITITVTDSSENEQTAVAVIAVVDTMVPLVRTKDIEVNLDNSGKVLISPEDINDGSEDACGISEVVLDKTEFTCEDIGENTVTLTVIDSNGNQNQSTAKVTVMDDQAPIIIAKNIIVNLDQNGQVSLPENSFYSEISDNCSVGSIQVSQSTFNCISVGENEVLITAMDTNRNQQTATSVVTVRDLIKPDVKTKNITVSLDKNGKASVSPEDIDNGSFDACGIDSFSLDRSFFNCEDLGENIVNLEVTDVHGNTNSASAMVRVIDNEIPVIQGRNREVYLDVTGRASVRQSDLYSGLSDNCEIATVQANKLQFECTDIGSNTISITAIDVSGNKVETEVLIEVHDTIAPALKTKPLVVALDNVGGTELNARSFDNGTTDACGEVTFEIDKSSFTCLDIGIQDIRVTAIDLHGNKSSVIEKLQVIDTISPVIVKKDKTVELDQTGNAVIEVSDLYSSVTDNCALGKITASKLAFSCGDLGANTVEVSVTDASGNKTLVESTVTVLDKLAPELEITDITLELDENGMINLNEEDIVISSGDNCSNVQIEYSRTRFTCTDKGINEVKVMARDMSGNLQEKTALVTVTDKRPPVILSNDLIVDLDTEGKVRLNPSDLYTTVTDNCQLKSLVATPLNFSCADVGERTVTIVAIDEDNNTTEAEARVVIRDTRSPIMRAKNIIVSLDDSGSVLITPQDIDNGSEDNCDMVLSADKYEFSCSDVGINNVILKGTDNHGNESTIIAQVTVLGDSEVIEAASSVALSPLNAVCENADIIVTLENTVHEIIYSMVNDDNQIIGRGIGTGGDLEISLVENVIDTEWSIVVSNSVGCQIGTGITGRIVNATELEADFEREGSGEILVDVPVQFLDRSVGVVSHWQWTLDRDTFSIKDPRVTFRQQGIRSLKLMVQSHEGCRAERIKNYIVEGEWMATAPTAFSPNAVLPENRVFKVITRGLREERLIIYDRSGRVVHRGDNEWNGTITLGGDILPGPYIFEFHAETVNGVSIHKRGRFMLF